MKVPLNCINQPFWHHVIGADNLHKVELGHLVSILTRPAIYQASMPLVQSAVLNVLQLCTPLLSRSDNFSTVVGWIDRIVIDEPSQVGVCDHNFHIRDAFL